MDLKDLAKRAVETYIKKDKIISPPENLPEKFKKERAGVFVTIEKNDNLRGCIGTYLPLKENIAKEVIQNAISAAKEDYRFGPIKKEELPYLSYSVYILGAPEKISSELELNPQKYGIIVKSGPKIGLLLPGLKDIKTKEEQIFFACQKAGIIPGKEPIEIYRFEAEKY
jgi:AmmeMemoRadiSam system protein A